VAAGFYHALQQTGCQQLDFHTIQTRPAGRAVNVAQAACVNAPQSDAVDESGTRGHDKSLELAPIVSRLWWGRQAMAGIGINAVIYLTMFIKKHPK
jgi:hypothetical protein